MKKIKLVLWVLVLVSMSIGCTPKDGEALLVMGTINEEDYYYDINKGQMEGVLLFYPKDENVKEVNLVVSDGKEQVFSKKIEAIKEENIISFKTFNTAEGFVFEGGMNDISEQAILIEDKQSIFAKALYVSQYRESHFDLLQYLEKHETVPCEIEVVTFTLLPADITYTVSIVVK